MRRLREHSTTYLMKQWQMTVDRAGERDNAATRQRLQVPFCAGRPVLERVLARADTAE